MKEFETTYRHHILWGLIVLTLVGAALVAAPFVPAILWATILTVLTFPLYRRLKGRMNENVASGLTVLLTLTIIIVPLVGIGGLLFAESSSFLNKLRAGVVDQGGKLSIEQVLAEADLTLMPLYERGSSDFRLREFYLQNREELVARITGPLGRVAVELFVSIFTIVIALLTQFFMLRDAHRLRDPALDLIPLPRDRSMALLDRLQNTIVGVFTGVVLVAIIQATIAGIAYFITGVSGALLWAAATFILCIIPLLGAPIVYVPLGVMMLAQGMYWQAGVILGVGFGLISTVDNLLRPFAIGNRVGFHAMLVFFSLLGGVLLMGPPGLMGGPLIAAVLITLIDVVRENRAAAQAAEAA